MKYPTVVLNCLFDDEDIIDNFVHHLVEESARCRNVQHRSDVSAHSPVQDHRCLPREKHCMFNHTRAKKSILSEHLGQNLFLGKKFDLMFWGSIIKEWTMVGFVSPP